jgi:FAD/FMN-containing dehydrogenase
LFRKCGTLRKEYGSDSVLWPTDNAYKSFLETYWSAQQRNIEPGCVFKPQTAQDVSVAVLLSRRSGCPFAVKSGGHSAVPGGSNIQRGVTISFERMNQTVVSADKKTVSFQPGQTWTEVYTKLAKDNLVIIGGRVRSASVRKK